MGKNEKKPMQKKGVNSTFGRGGEKKIKARNTNTEGTREPQGIP